MTNRIVQFDLIRGLCMLYIVGLWHFNNYLGQEYQFSPIVSEWLQYLTIAVLATFTFISGYMLRKYEFHSRSDVVLFYYKRLQRFYLLFLLSAVSLFLMRWMSGSQFLNLISGLALFSSQPVKTLWYISMIMLLYAITPLIRWNVKSRVEISSLIIVGIAVLLFGLLFSIGHADERLLLYTPAYFIGLFTWKLPTKRINWVYILVVSILVFVLSILKLSSYPVLQHCIVALSGGASIIALGFIVPIIHGSKIIISFLAYCSMAVYLFHRQFFGISLYLFGVRGNGEPYLPLWLALIVLVITFLCSWLIQKGYDTLITKSNRVVFGKS